MTKSRAKVKSKRDRVQLALNELEAYLDGLAVTLNETATGLENWWRAEDSSDHAPSDLHPYHAANRLRKIARELKRKET